MSAHTVVKIVEVSHPGQVYQARIHASGCSDIAKDRARGYTDTHTMNVSGPSWLEETFGDIASDEHEPNTEEWNRELRYQGSEVTVCACAAGAGFSF